MEEVFKRFCNGLKEVGSYMHGHCGIAVVRLNECCVLEHMQSGSGSIHRLAPCMM